MKLTAGQRCCGNTNCSLQRAICWHCAGQSKRVPWLCTKCDGSGGDCNVTAPVPSSVATLAVPAAMSCEGRFNLTGRRKIFELAESRHRLLGTKRYVVSPCLMNVAGLRQLKLF